MEKVTISFNKDLGNINKKINRYLIDKDIEISEELLKNRVFLNFNAISDEIDTEAEYYHTISNFVTDIIICYYSKEIIGRKIFLKYKDLSRKDKVLIIDIAYNMFIQEERFTESKRSIYKEVLDYIMENNEIIIDGFARFRLEKFKNNINRLIEKSAEEYFAEKEYKEFIKILQYFVDIQQPKLDVINIVIKGDDYKLFDDKNDIIEKEYYNEIINELANEGINNDDLLISTLIVIAPKKIIIHGKEKDKEKEIVEIINSVFTHKVQYCLECEMCKEKKSIKKGE